MLGWFQKDVILTTHAEERLRLRRIPKRYAVATVHRPDAREPEADGKMRFTKTIRERKVQVVAKYLEDERKWLVVSAWVRGEEDPLPLWRRILNRLFGR